MNDEKFRGNEWSSKTVRRVNVTAQLVSSLTARGPEPVKHEPSRSNVWVPLTSGGSKTPDTKTACAVVASAANAVATNARASTLRRVLSATSYSQKVKSAKAECGSRTTSNSHTNRVQLLELFDGFSQKLRDEHQAVRISDIILGQASPIRLCQQMASLKSHRPCRPARGHQTPIGRPR